MSWAKIYRQRASLVATLTLANSPSRRMRTEAPRQHLRTDGPADLTRKSGCHDTRSGRFPMVFRGFEISSGNEKIVVFITFVWFFAEYDGK
jgi:hypothetical protein